MASAARAKILLDSLDEKVEALKEAVDKLSAAAQQISEDRGNDEKKVPATPEAVTQAAQP
jgi:hypothetical protein